MADPTIPERYWATVWRRFKFMGWIPWAMILGGFMQRQEDFHQTGLAVLIIGTLAFFDRIFRLRAAERRQGLTLSPMSRRIGLLAAITMIAVVIGAFIYLYYSLDGLRKAIGQ